MGTGTHSSKTDILAALLKRWTNLSSSMYHSKKLCKLLPTLGPSSSSPRVLSYRNKIVSQTILYGGDGMGLSGGILFFKSYVCVNLVKDLQAAAVDLWIQTTWLWIPAFLLLVVWTWINYLTPLCLVHKSGIHLTGLLWRWDYAFRVYHRLYNAWRVTE